MQMYTKEELETRMIRPLKVGEQFMVCNCLDVNASLEMSYYLGDWLTVSSVDRTKYHLREPHIEPDGRIVCYTVKEDEGTWTWFPYHINILETNKRILEKDSSLLFRKGLSGGLPNL